MMHISTHYGEQQADMPTAVLVSPCSSDEFSDSTVAAAVSITGRFGNIEHEYRIDPRVIGTGHYGLVRECVNRTTGERYAVKSICKSSPAVKPGSLAREIMLLEEMKHRSIVQLVDVYEDVECLHIITDLCEGGELFERIIQKRSRGDCGEPCFAEDEAARILCQILAAVSYMHKRGIVHRDIKPENVLFETADGDSPVKIVDFGFARRYSGNRGEPPMKTVVGTSYYVAPEVLRRRYDKSCDLWSVGVMTYVLLCGYFPFNGATVEELHDSVRRGRYHFPPEDWSGTSRGARDFIRRLLQKDPRNRLTVERALNHPWMVKHNNNGFVMSDEVRQDDSSVEIVFEGLSRSESTICAGMEKCKMRMPVLCCYQSAIPRMHHELGNSFQESL